LLRSRDDGVDRITGSEALASRTNQKLRPPERLAYYGVRLVIPIYIASSEDPGGLHFTNADKGTILMVWALVQTLLPMVTGGYADRYGRKLTIGVSIAIKICGYLLMATQRSYAGFMIGCIVLATGTAVFKPGVWGTLSRGR
jgi:POT family proton-dependent oligopeptide transporter